ncbi:polysaccharide deacetylase family protein [Streptomyces tsukubensis]|uniref:Polysaccharide deacetylase family protein n=2 Tax=Streptomyces TaxID=1883 RepID=I2N071_STRT9|nr:deacetylase [Streptomyces tsukubensis]EIF90418.1 deacetylase [Streptomyces tsukubensis NRRL18488]MYS65520.1 polysaccharide deacetylase family protein [Streptomyces sp. SID5473]QKM69256.1 polysaccharide deacetylase family protein [Streptomyces tsukubensis NRRL18488]TAI42811.1 polysaccharide deacetylase family protein [Streptomyces tsukubensis]
MPATRRNVRLAAAAALVALAVPVLAGCGMETTAPATARGDAKGEPAPGTTDCEKVKCIALTFDSSPGKKTPQLLDYLKKEKVPVTFFVMGRNHLTKWPEVVKRFSDEGHEVANHTWTHPRLDKLKKDEIREELSRTNVELEKITGRKPTLMRPPQGRINDDVTAVSKELGLAQILWNATAKDYSTNDSALIESRILKQAKKDGIILLHDIYDGTVPAVPGIVTELKKRGYTFVTVSQLLAPAKANPGEIYRP